MLYRLEARGLGFGWKEVGFREGSITLSSNCWTNHPVMCIPYLQYTALKGFHLERAIERERRDIVMEDNMGQIGGKTVSKSGKGKGGG